MSGKNQQHSQSDGTTKLDSDTSSSTKEHSHNNSNQRITRSSQKAAAQQVKNDNVQSEVGNADDQHQLDNSEKDLGRKLKRRKGDTVQDSEQDVSQSATVIQQPLMVEIDPADYLLPPQNSFQLYREIRNFPLKKLSELAHIQPKAPYGFREYLLNSGLYLLDGNEMGSSLLVQTDNIVNNADNSTSTTTTTSKSDTSSPDSSTSKNNLSASSSSSSFTRLTTESYQAQNSSSASRYDKLNNNLAVSNNLPKISSPPAKLKKGSELYRLFEEHELARYQMRIQHLKERERLILSAEQEVLRAYNRAAIADKCQKHHLSACTFLYFQERYHYSDQSTDNQNKQEGEFIDKHHEQLQEIDEKWERLKNEMLIRHRNEADSLYAVQSMEWEWKAKELGLCDVKLPFKLEPEFVPRIEIITIDY